MSQSGSHTPVDNTERREAILEVVRDEGPTVGSWIAYCLNWSPQKVTADLRWLATHGFVVNANPDPEGRSTWALTVEGERHLDEERG